MKSYMNCDVVLSVLQLQQLLKMNTHLNCEYMHTEFMNINDSINFRENVPYRVVKSNCLPHFWITRETLHKVLKCPPFF